jgi:hypothetical protein
LLKKNKKGLEKGLIFLVTFLGQTEYNYDSNYKAGAAQIEGLR